MITFLVLSNIVFIILLLHSIRVYKKLKEKKDFREFTINDRFKIPAYYEDIYILERDFNIYSSKYKDITISKNGISSIRTTGDDFIRYPLACSKNIEELKQIKNLILLEQIEE